MRRPWKYRLENEGVKLREIIDCGGNDVKSCVSTLKQVKLCCAELLNQLEIVDKNNYMRQIENLIDEMDLLGSLDGYDACLAEDEVNYILGEFYDICDDCRCWIPL